MELNWSTPDRPASYAAALLIGLEAERVVYEEHGVTLEVDGWI